MENQKKMKLLEDVFELGEDELNPETELEGLESWDSMTKLSLIVMIEEEYGKVLQSDIIRKFKTISDILAYME